MARDTIDAVARSPEVAVVVVVSDEPQPAGQAEEPNLRWVPDRGDGDLNRCLTFAVGDLPGHTPVAVVVADLPTLQSRELSRLLAAAVQQPFGVVADREGRGTSILVAAEPARLHPHFGPESFTAHRDAGAVNLNQAAGPSLRLDVDTLDDLRTALVHGVGAATTRLLVDSPSLLDMADRRTHATVARFDPATHSGTVLLDDGLEVPFDAAAFRAGGTLNLRLGQRVQLMHDSHGVICAIFLATMAP